LSRQINFVASDSDRSEMADQICAVFEGAFFLPERSVGDMPPAAPLTRQALKEHEKVCLFRELDKQSIQRIPVPDGVWVDPKASPCVQVILRRSEPGMARAGRVYLASEVSPDLEGKVNRVFAYVRKRATMIPGGEPYRAFPDAAQNAALFEYGVGRKEPNPWKSDAG
jgi:hypothetical protein